MNLGALDFVVLSILGLCLGTGIYMAIKNIRQNKIRRQNMMGGKKERRNATKVIN